MKRVNGFFRTPTRAEIERSIPADWTRLPAMRLALPKYIELVNWLLNDNVVDRGVRSMTEIALSTGLIPDRMAWELLRSGLEKARESESGVTQAMGGMWPSYDVELAFASDEDAVMFKMRFC